LPCDIQANPGSTYTLWLAVFGPACSRTTECAGYAQYVMSRLPELLADPMDLLFYDLVG
jgi:hypothetical protein